MHIYKGKYSISTKQPLSFPACGDAYEEEQNVLLGFQLSSPGRFPSCLLTSAVMNLYFVPGPGTELQNSRP